MVHAKTFFMLATAAAVLGACAGTKEDPNTLHVTYSCNPAGATLYQENVNVGMCPTTLRYKVSDEDRARGYKLLRGITAYWVSGASSSVNSIKSDLEKGLHQNFTFERPRSLPNYEVDANYAINLEKNRILRVQAEATRAQAEAAALQAEALQQALQAPPRGTHCTTRNIGNTVYTDCD
jgi:hypothetical protein